MAQSSRASTALQFMHRCRQSRTSPTHQQIRHSTTTLSNSSSSSSSSSSSPYDPSNFSKPMHRESPSSSTAASTFDSPIRSPFPSKPRARPLPPPTETVYPGLKHSLWTSVKMAFGWKPRAPSGGYAPAPFTWKNNPYKARKTWPPNFDALHAKQQFHFEKTYRRRAKLAYARPRWNRRIRTLQHTGVMLTVAYFVFICEPEDKMGTPFDGFRAWFFAKLKDFRHLPEATRFEAERLESEARETMKSRRSLLSGTATAPSQSPVAPEVAAAER